MADGDLLSIRIDTRATVAALDSLQRDIDRATQQALRAAGRKVSQSAKRGAPVASGRLKRSVHQSKRLTRAADGGFKLYVGPSGGVVNLYRGKAEEQTGFMAQARRDAEAAMIEAYVTTFNKAMARFGR